MSGSFFQRVKDSTMRFLFIVPMDDSASRMGVEDMARRANRNHRERIHRSQRIAMTWGFVIVLVGAFAMYITPIMSHWQKRAEVRVLSRRLEAERQNGREPALPETSWDKVIFGRR